MVVSASLKLKEPLLAVTKDSTASMTL